MTLARKIEEDIIFNLRTHQIFASDFQQIYTQIRSRLISESEKSLVNLKEQLDVLDQLAEFPLGRFIIEHKGLNGYWLNYTLTTSVAEKGVSELERFFLERAPATLAMRDSFTISQQIIQQNLKNGIVIASIPCGVMANVLTIDYSSIKEMRLIGIDLDFEALVYANQLAEDMKLGHEIEFSQYDAWKIDTNSEYDIISSHGLNLYLDHESELIELYERLNRSLKNGGLLISSFLPPSPSRSADSPWVMAEINEEDLRLQKIMISDVARVKWRHYYTYDQVANQMKHAGFKSVEFIPDKACMRPTVVAQK